MSGRAPGVVEVPGADWSACASPDSLSHIHFRSSQPASLTLDGEGIQAARKSQNPPRRPVGPFGPPLVHNSNPCDFDAMRLLGFRLKSRWSMMAPLPLSNVLSSAAPIWVTRLVWYMS